jgi:2-polyprenyl-3-methyl-5-hydroxy-6-metoxy-1,4-benzoquinol methylase
MRRFLTAVGRWLVWPYRRFFDPRFAGLTQQVVEHGHATRELVAAGIAQATDQYQALDSHAEGRHREASVAHDLLRGDLAHLQDLIHADMDATSEAVTLLGQSFREIETSIAASVESLEATRRLTEEAWTGTERYVDELAKGPIENLHGGAVRLLNYATGHSGFAAQRHLWFNPPVDVQFADSEAFIGHINERIAEVPFVLRALGGVHAGAKILDVGASESTLCLSLATLGYQVTAVDPRPNPLRHPNLVVVEGRIEEWSDQDAGDFDVTICLSTIEHIGVGAYGQEEEGRRTDLVAMRRMRELTRPEGLLVLTTSYGPSGTDDFSRTYDQNDLDELLEEWDVGEMAFLVRENETTWLLQNSSEAPEPSSRETVVMLTARRRE